MFSSRNTNSISSLRLRYGLYVTLLLILLLLITWGLFSTLGRFAYTSWNQTVETYGLIQSLENPEDSTKQKAFQNMVRKSEALMQAVPQNGRASYLLKKVSVVDKVSGKKGSLQLLDIKTDKEVPHRGYVEYPIEMSLRGSFPSLHQYIAALENMDVAIQIRELSIEAPILNRETLDIFLEMSAYVFTP